MNELDKPIGTKEAPKLTAGSVVVKAVTVLTKGEGNKKFKITEFEIMHPDREEPVKISNLKIKKVQGNNETITKDGIWYREDSDGNLDKNCNSAKLMSFYNKTSLRQFENSTITTELDANGYLTIKAY